MSLNSESCVFRYIVFVLACVMSFGTYFAYDMPSVLQKQFEGPSNKTCESNGSSSTNRTSSFCCTGCLGLSSLQYNLLFACYSWVNALTVLLLGYFIDKFGNGVSGIFFSSIIVTGVALFASGSLPSFRGTSLSFSLLLSGRIILGAVTGGVRIVQDRIVTYWFKRDVSLAFGVLMAFARASSVINFLFTDIFAETYGLNSVLWMCVFICGVGFISSIFLRKMDTYGLKQLGLHEKRNRQSENMSLADIRKFPRLYWYIILTMLFYFSSILPFFADASKFLQDKYHLSSLTASYISGIVFDICVVFSPIMGYILDHIGKRAWCFLLITALTLPIFPLLAFTDIHPAYLFTSLGLTYSCAGVSMWPSISLVIHSCNIGTAFGVTTSLVSIGIGVNNWGIGKFLGHDMSSISAVERLARWRLVLLLAFINCFIAVIFSIVLNIHDIRIGTVVNVKRPKSVREGGYISSSSEPPTPTNETTHLLGNKPPIITTDALIARKLSMSFSNSIIM